MTRDILSTRAWLAASALVALAGCASSASPPAVGTDAAADAADAALAPARRAVAGDSPYERLGPHPVGHTTFVVTDAARSRTLRLQLWYPADAAASAAATAGTPLAELEPPGEARDAVARLVAAAGPCSRTRVASAADAKPLAGAPWPVVAFSHCYGCMRYSAAQSMERLASHGVAVVAPDHAGGTLFDVLKGVRSNIDAASLALRVGDVRFALDAVLDANNPAVPEALRGRLDPARVGVMGHSFGAVTTGAVLAQDPRPLAAFAIAAPIDALGGLKVAELKKPVFYLLAQEDNSIGEIGNNLLRNNFGAMTAPSWLVEVADAGHWSFSDVCGLHPSFRAGCGRAGRQTDTDLELNYLENDGARALAASYAAAFFRAHLAADAAGLAFLNGAHPKDLVTVRAR
ncbi:MAG: dienelactone hydrolase family protein [Myxococcales bacterium]|nr:dienelactone hydrolase family protein [Myxococcales bacterium]